LQSSIKIQQKIPGWQSQSTVNLHGVLQQGKDEMINCNIKEKSIHLESSSRNDSNRSPSPMERKSKNKHKKSKSSKKTKSRHRSRSRSHAKEFNSNKPTAQSTAINAETKDAEQNKSNMHSIVVKMPEKSTKESNSASKSSSTTTSTSADTKSEAKKRESPVTPFNTYQTVFIRIYFK
jgi:hypothetical protein